MVQGHLFWPALPADQARALLDQDSDVTVISRQIRHAM
jgi:hypothetical protein